MRENNTGKEEGSFSATQNWLMLPASELGVRALQGFVMEVFL